VRDLEIAVFGDYLYCLTHKSKQIQILDKETLGLKQNGMISINQELIEFAYDNDYQI